MKNLGKSFKTQKQWLCVAVLAFVCTGMAFAQTRPATPAPAQPARPGQPAAQAAPAASAKKNAISLDANYLIRGFIESDTDADRLLFCLAPTYERLITSRISIGPEMQMIFGSAYTDTSIFFLGIGFNTRIYPMSEQMDKLFLGASLGFHLQWLDGELDTDKGGLMSLYSAVSLGYRFNLVRNVFFIEPSVAYTYTKGDFGVLGNLGWTAAVRLGFAF